ncbi:MAG: T9SS type A sorting domain-containing protein, partial [Bacteroidota bacterium]
DPTGTNAIANGNGIGFSANPTANIVKGNIISGNHNIGIILFESADSNEVTLNLIGVQADGTSALGNGLSGIVIGSGASNNRIGAPGEGNIIAFNGNGGVVVMDSVSINNTISANSIFMNEVLPGIDLTPFGVTANDAGDNDTGPNLLMNKPEIQDAITDPGGLILIQGTIDTQSPETTMIELFVAEPDATGYGQGKTYIGCTAANNLGQWGCYFSFPGINAGDEITATATDASGNTSEFAQNVSAIVGIRNKVKNNDVSVYPNPACDYIIINGEDIRNIRISDINGKILYSGEYRKKLNVSFLPEGVYILTIYTDMETIRTKLIRQ